MDPRRPLVLLLLVAGCAAPPDPWAKRSLDPYPNPFTADDPLWAAQPHRDRPRASALGPGGGRLYVALHGAEDLPSSTVAVVDLPRGAVAGRVPVGRAPIALALHPGGRFLVVANLLSNWLSVIDTQSDRVVAEPPTPWYATAIAFSADGGRLYVANRWQDALLTYTVRVDGDRFLLGDPYRDRPPDGRAGVPTSQNPSEILVAADGRVVVGSIAGQAVDLFSADGGTRLGGIAVGSPVGGMATVGRFLVVSHIGRGSGFVHDQGVDGDQDGRPGDGTGNVMFQDLQNELEVFDLGSLASVGQYTSDSICCHDFRDVDPALPDRGLLLPSPDTWPPTDAKALPPRERWIVAGALPTRMALLPSPTPGKRRLLVVMSASNEAQRFELDEQRGTLTAVDRAGALYPTGHFPADVVATADGRAAYVVDRLGESVTVLDPAAPPSSAPPRRIVVGDEGGGPFPASDVELGELFNHVTAPLTLDGDQSCVHCHRDGGNLDRVVAMPLQTNRIWGSRQVQAYRGAYDTRPWFLEGAMDEKNFFPVLNEFNRKENFCCEALDPLIWSKYPSPNTCLAKPATAGCNHVLRCETEPPPECAKRPYGSPHPIRDQFLLGAVERLAGRRTSFGDSLRLAGTRQPIALDFDGITRAIGLFLLASPRLPPNPNRALDLAAARRGEALYRRVEVGCQSCHPLPLTTVAGEPAFSPFGLPVRLPPVITPTLDPKGQPADLITDGFRATFVVAGLGPTEQGPEGIHFGVPQLRGLWDRAARFYHDGRSHTLRGALLPPGHPSLGGDKGANERFGVIDTHGGTSHLTPDEVDDLIAFLLSL